VHRGYDVAQVAAEPDERRTAASELVADRHLRVDEALPQQVQGQHLGVVVVVHNLGGAGGGRREGPETALTVGDVRTPGEPAQPGGQHPVAQPAPSQHPTDLAGEPRADHVVGGAGEHRGDDGVDVLGKVLAVGVEVDHGGRTQRHRLGQAPAHGGTQSPVVGVPHDDRTGIAGDPGRAVVGPVIDDDRHQWAATHRLG